MSAFGTPGRGAASAQPKQISSRLLNMKFMQRAAASTTGKDSSNPSTPSHEPRPKRRRTGDFSFTAENLNSPSTPSTATNTPVYADRIVPPGAFATESTGEYTRRGTNNYEAAGHETEWVLNVRLPITNATSNDVDADHDSENESDDDEDDIWSPTEPRGRQTYGSFKKKRKTVDANSGTGAATPASASDEKKRSRAEDLDDEELSPISSEPDSDEESEGEILEPPPVRLKKNGTFDFKSEADLKRMDSLDFSKSGFNHGFGRQRQGLAGKGAFASPGNHPRRPKKKMRKTM